MRLLGHQKHTKKLRFLVLCVRSSERVKPVPAFDTLVAVGRNYRNALLHNQRVPSATAIPSCVVQWQTRLVLPPWRRCRLRALEHPNRLQAQQSWRGCRRYPPQGHQRLSSAPVPAPAHSTLILRATALRAYIATRNITWIPIWSFSRQTVTYSWWQAVLIVLS